MLVWRGIACLLFCTALAGPNATSIEICGKVTGEKGEPLEGVRVYSSECCPPKYGQALTDSNGDFKIGDPGRVLYFHKDGFTPVSRVVDARQTVMKVTMEPKERSQWVIPRCADKKEEGERVGKFFRFLIPKGTKIRKTQDIDYIIYWVKPPSGKNWLAIWSGPLVGGLDPEDTLLTESSSFTERAVTSGSVAVGIDARGESPRGVWRQVGLGTELARYRKVSKGSAGFFDSIIDSVCASPPRR